MSRAPCIGKIEAFRVGWRALSGGLCAPGRLAQSRNARALAVECMREFHYRRGFFSSQNARCAPRTANGRGKS
jgi:hypothetical protein